MCGFFGPAKRATAMTGVEIMVAAGGVRVHDLPNAL